MTLSLSRGLTNAAFVDYLEADSRLAPLAGCLVDDTVIGDQLIDAVAQWKSGNPEALRPYFPTAQIGVLGSLAQNIHLFVAVEKELEKQKKQSVKADRDEEKRERLLAKIAAEREAAISGETMGMCFRAHQAAEELGEAPKALAKRAAFEKDGHTFTFKVALDCLESQPQWQYYLDHQDEMLELIGGELLSSTKQVDTAAKKKKGGKAKMVLLQKIKVT
jgi:hypothetical protein